MPENEDFPQQESGKCPTTPGVDLGHSGVPMTIPTDIFNNFGLSDIQLRAIELTVNGHSDSDIARSLEIDRKTLWRWKTIDENYRRILAETRAQRYAASADRYQHLLLGATAVIAKFLVDESEQNRFRAAALLLNMAGCFRPKKNASSPSQKDDNGIRLFTQPVLPAKVG